MKRILIALAAGVAGYVVGAIAGIVLVHWFSPNVHDRSVEAAMTGVFVFGPAGALVAGLVALAWPRRGVPGGSSAEP